MSKPTQRDSEKQDPIAEITAHAHQEIIWVRGAYKFAASIIGVIVIFGIFFTYQSTRDFKNELKQDGLDEQQRVNKEVDILKQKVMQDMQTEVVSVRQEVVKRINDEFANSNIVALVNDQAKEKITTVSDTLIHEFFTNQVMPISAELDRTLQTHDAKDTMLSERIFDRMEEARKVESDLQNLIVRTQSALDEESDLILTLIAAQNNDATAYDKLVSWSRNPNDSRRIFALKATQALKPNRDGRSAPQLLPITPH